MQLAKPDPIPWPPDSLVALHQQLGQAIANLRAAPRAKKEAGGAA